MSDLATTPGATILDTSGAPNEPVVEPVENADQPTGTAMDNAIADEFPGDPMAAAMASIFEKRGITPPSLAPDDGPASDADEPAPASSDADEQPAPEAPVETQEPPAATLSASTLLGPDEGGVISTWKYGDRELTAEQVQHALSLMDWDQSLSPEQVVAINEYLSGNAVLAPAAPAPASGGVGSPAGAGTPTAPAGTPSPAAPLEPLPELDPDDPLGAHIARLTATVEAQAAQTQALYEQQRAAELTRVAAEQRTVTEAGIAAAQTAVGEQYNLDAEQVEALSQAAGRLQIIPALQTKHRGNVEATMREALDIAFWSTPEFRDSFIAGHADTAVTEATVAAQSLDERKRKASSLGGRGAPPARQAPPPAAMTPDQRKAAMVNEIAQHING